MKNKTLYNLEIKGIKENDKTYIHLWAINIKDIETILKLFYDYSITINKFVA